MKYPKGIKVIYDIGKKIEDRYVIILKEHCYDRYYSAIVTSDNPKKLFQLVCIKSLSGLGRKISWLSLPKSVRNLINKER